MILANVDVGTGPGAGDGDPLRSAFITINDNFTRIQSNLNALVNSPVMSVAGRTGNVSITTQDIIGLSPLTYPNAAVIGSWISSNVSALIAGAPGVLDTLNELANALGNNANFSTTITNSLASLTANAGAQAGSITDIYSNLAAVSGSLSTLTANAAVQAGLISNITSYSNSRVASYLVAYGGNVKVNTIVFDDLSEQYTAYTGTQWRSNLTSDLTAKPSWLSYYPDGLKTVEGTNYGFDASGMFFYGSSDGEHAYPIRTNTHLHENDVAEVITTFHLAHVGDDHGIAIFPAGTTPIWNYGAHSSRIAWQLNSTIPVIYGQSNTATTGNTLTVGNYYTVKFVYDPTNTLTVDVYNGNAAVGSPVDSISLSEALPLGDYVIGFDADQDVVSNRSYFKNLTVRTLTNTVVNDLEVRGQVNGNLIPSSNVAYSLGNITHQWKDLWVSNSTIYISGIPLSVDSGGALLVNGAPISTTSNVTFTDTTMTGTPDSEVVVAAETAERVRAQLRLEPTSGDAVLEAWSGENTRSDTTWATGVWENNIYGNPLMTFTGAFDLAFFVVETLQSSADPDTVSYSINGGPYIAWDSGSSVDTSTGYVQIYTSGVSPNVSPTAITSLDWRYAYKSSIGVSHGNGSIQITGRNQYLQVDIDQYILVNSRGSIELNNSNYGNNVDIELRSGDDIILQAKDKTSSDSEGGDILIYAGNGGDADTGDPGGTGGDIVIEAGTGGAPSAAYDGGTGGTLDLYGGNGGSADAGNNRTAKDGGRARLRAGSAGSNGGNVSLGAVGGPIEITAGSTTLANNNGGTVTITSGLGGTNALAGNLEIVIPSSDLGSGGTWTFDGYGNLTLPGGGAIDGSDYDVDITAGNDGVSTFGHISFTANGPNGLNSFTYNSLGEITVVTAGANDGLIKWVGNSSGDGNGYTTMVMVPDTTREGTDQYIIIDPTGGEPGHIHLRAGGTQDASGADLYLGGELTFVRVSDTSGIVTVRTTNIGDPNITMNWAFQPDGGLYFPGIGNYRIGESEPGLVVSSSYAVGLQSNNGGESKEWLFGTDGVLTLPSGGNVVFDSSAVSVIDGVSSIVFADSTVQNTAYSNAAVGTYLADHTAKSIGGNVTIDGNLFVNGNISYISTNSYVVADNIVQFADSNPADSLDLGFVAHRTVGGTLQHTGFVRDATDGKWKLFSNVVPQVGQTVDFTNAVYDDVKLGNVIFGDATTQTTAWTGSAPTLDVTNTNGLTTTYYPTFVENRTTGQIARADVNLTYRTDDNILGVGNIAIGAAGNIKFADNTLQTTAWVGNINRLTNAANVALTWGTDNSLTSGGTGLINIRSNNMVQLAYEGVSSGTNISDAYVQLLGGPAANSGVVITFISNSATYSWTFNGNRDFILPTGGNIQFGDGTRQSTASTGSGSIYSNANVVSLLSNFGSNSITTTGNITAQNFIGNISVTGNVVGTSANVTLVAGSYSWTFDNAGNLVLPGNVFAVNYANGTVVSLGGAGSTYGNANVAVFLSNFGSNTVITTGNITAGNVRATTALRFDTGNVRVTNEANRVNLIPDTTADALAGVLIGGSGYLLGPNGSRNITLNYGGGSGVVGLQANVQVGSAGTGTILVPGFSATGVTTIVAGVTNTLLPNTVASFSSNVNNYTQLTLQNKSTGSDATSDIVLTSDAGSDTTNYVDIGIINSGYDNATPTNSLGNVVFANDAYLYAQGNTSATVGGNLAIGTTTAGKSVKVFAGGNTASSIVMTVANTGVTVAGNINSGNIITTGNIIGSSPNVTITANTYVTTFDIYGNVTVPGTLTVNGMGVTMPARPAFRIYGAGSTNWTTSNTNFKGSSIVVDYNQGSYFNSTTGVFTAPIAGLYSVTLTARIGNNNGQNQIMILKNGLNTAGNVVAMWECDTNTGTAVHYGVSSVMKLAAGDFLTANITVGAVQFDANDSWTVTYIG